MTAYVESVRRLTRPRYDNPRTGKRVDSLSTVLTGNSTAMYWSDNDAPLLIGLPLLRDDPKRVRDLLYSPRQGAEKSVGDPNHFYCLILTGVQGRAIVRRAHMGTVAEVEDNLRLYFETIDVDRFDRGAPLPQFRLLKSLVLNGELDRLPAELGTELWLAALFGTPLSRSFLSAVVTRNRAERKVTPERAALLHLYFIGRRRLVSSAETARPSSQNAKENPKEMSLNRESKDQPYLLGRLLAVLENVQTAAQGQGLNRTLVDRTFGAASTRPGVIFPQLIQTAQHHFAKAGRKVERRAMFLNKLLGEIMDGLELDGFAATLNLEQQGRFALGYYHQRQSFYRSKPEDAGPAPTPETTDTTKEETAA
jgi:CRISPR-associated protein Csd1